MKIASWQHDKSKIPSVVTWGVFDGVHAAHNELLHKLISLGRRFNLRPIVITFSKHPANVLYNAGVKLICTLEERIKLIQEAGIKQCLVVSFTKGFSRIGGDKFVRQLALKLNAKIILLGYDSRFGYKRKYGENELKHLCSLLGIKIFSQNVVRIGGRAVSSRQIRFLLSKGRLQEASKMLGRCYSVERKVVKGYQLGRTIRFPTANLDIKNKSLLIPFGVYKTLCCVGRKKYQSVTHYGPRPVIKSKQPTIETHLINYDGADLYSKYINVQFIKRLRRIRSFKNFNQLRSQIARDISCWR
ncbi:MAG: bifunctional riboflavin kinase/FAD synthetase [Planctomycetes bacterium]|nr:bifunctional riboflavin kinase/FAD synthetase [Planctomycetota bacterium]